MRKTYWVTMTDEFMSGWGRAEGKTNKLVLTCDNFEEAEIVYDNAKRRSEMKRVQITSTKPYYTPKRYFVSWHDKTDYETWFKSDQFMK